LYSRLRGLGGFAVSRWLSSRLAISPALSVCYDHNDPISTPAGRRDAKRVSLHEASFKKALHAGVKIVIGTDVGR